MPKDKAMTTTAAKRRVRSNKGKVAATSLREKPSPQRLGRVASKRKFLEGMCQYGTIQKACDYAGISNTVYYYWTDTKWQGGKYYDEEFVHECVLAKEAYRDVLREAARMRAVDGIEKPVFGSLGKGEGTGVVGHVQEYSDRLLEVLMRIHLPESEAIGGSGQGVTVNNTVVQQNNLLLGDIKIDDLPLDLCSRLDEVLSAIDAWKKEQQSLVIEGSASVVNK